MSHSQQELSTSTKPGGRFFLFGFTHQSRTFVLLGALVLQIALAPLETRGSWLPSLLQIGTILAAVFMAADTKKHLRVGLGLSLPGILLLLLHGIITDTWFLLGGYVFLVLLYCYVIVLMLDKIFKAQKITIDIIVMALCTYLLLGAVWVLFYLPVAVFNPGAFNFPTQIGHGSASSTLQYFSYVTLTTLGYGDVYPISTWARALAVLEALSGTLFLAVLISRLVGSYASSRK